MIGADGVSVNGQAVPGVGAAGRPGQRRAQSGPRPGRYRGPVAGTVAAADRSPADARRGRRPRPAGAEVPGARRPGPVHGPGRRRGVRRFAGRAGRAAASSTTGSRAATSVAATPARSRPRRRRHPTPVRRPHRRRPRPTPTARPVVTRSRPTSVRPGPGRRPSSGSFGSSGSSGSSSGALGSGATSAPASSSAAPAPAGWPPRRSPAGSLRPDKPTKLLLLYLLWQSLVIGTVASLYLWRKAAA